MAGHNFLDKLLKMAYFSIPYRPLEKRLNSRRLLPLIQSRYVKGIE